MCYNKVNMSLLFLFTFLFGIAIGIVSGILLTIALISYSRGAGDNFERIVERGYPLPRDFKKEGVQFFDPGDETTDVQEEIYEENEKKGRDTNMDELK